MDSYFDGGWTGSIALLYCDGPSWRVMMDAVGSVAMPGEGMQGVGESFGIELTSLNCDSRYVERQM